MNVAHRFIVTGLLALTQVLLAVAACAAESEWAIGHKSKARLVVGSMPNAQGGAAIYAGMEIELDPDWKTYWRHPGDAGGVPPYFDWSKSQNLAKAEVMFPVPVRFRDATGDAIGYKKQVVLPIRIVPKDLDQPVGLAVNFQYGVCREICIPAQAKLALMVDPKALRVMPPQLADAIGQVPLPADKAAAGLPSLAGMTSRLTGKQPELVFDVRYPDGTDGADLFIEAGADVYLPMTTRVGTPQPDLVRFRVDLSNGVDLEKLAGRELLLTIASRSGGKEVVRRLPAQ